MAADPIDWSAAIRTGQRLAPSGPPLSAADATQVVSDLRRFSARAELAVRDTTGLGHGLPVADAEVVDRPCWIAATAQSMATLTEPLAQRLAQRTSRPLPGRSVAGAQVGAVLGFLSGRVLGQYDPLGGDPEAPGRLLLVAPNIVKIEREIGALPTDFRMWVCLHESTHRLQFSAVPWMREHFRGMVAEFAQAADLDTSDLLRRMVDALSGSGKTGQSWIETIQTPAQREVFDRLMALMTLLEGHADHVMDAVGPAVVPSVASIRAAFTARRRKGVGPFERLVRSLLGMEMKLAQYVHGAAFVSAVVDAAGMDRFNEVWTSPETLPTRDEIKDPTAWIRRVLG